MSAPIASSPLPVQQTLRKLGRDLALARRKRGISTNNTAARLFVSRDTLWRLERGDPSVSLGTLATAAFVLKLHDRLANLAAPGRDELVLAWMRCVCPSAFADALQHEPRAFFHCSRATMMPICATTVS